ncbi:MAG: aminopeptidase P family N-terminal domain-containing protein, partial [Ginsengibacter sp.]
MTLKRREFINLSALAATAGLVIGVSAYTSIAEGKEKQPGPDQLHSMANDVFPITTEEREARITKAQKLMAEQNIQALILDAGTTLKYFTGIGWWPSERTMVAIIPAKGTPIYVCPGFEESRFRELIKIGKDVYAWQEDESPYKLITVALKDAGIVSGKIGMEERLRFFFFDGVRQVAPQIEFVNGTSITMACRMIKSAAELALMQKANDITSAAIKFSIGQL